VSASNPLLTLLDIVNSPLLMFNAEGQVVFSNRAAKSLPCRPALLLGSDPHVRTLVRDIAEGRTSALHEMEVEGMSDDGIARLKCRTAPKPIAGLVAMAVSLAEEPAGETARSAAPVEQRLSLQQIMELLRAELMPPMMQVLGQSESGSLNDSVRTLHERLDRVVDLVNVFGEDVLIGDERMLIADMVHGVCEDLAPLTQQNGVAFLMEGIGQELPPVYGSARLMRRALHECLHNAVVHARSSTATTEQVVVGVRFKASGNHLLVDIHNSGVLSAAALQRHAGAIFRPSVQAGASGKPPVPTLQIGLPLAHRILQLHGGRLRIEQDSASELEVRLELPTGAPLRNTHHLDMLQAQIYAEDLSTLMARTRKRSTA
jgi:signal transduction histidine kinase